jgi:hypothetical protein
MAVIRIARNLLDRVDKCMRGEIDRLALVMPPGSTKSRLRRFFIRLGT